MSQRRQQEDTAPGGSLMPVCGSCRASRKPWEASWAYSAARKSGLCRCSPHPALTQPRPCCHSSVPAPLESSCPPTEMGVAPKPRGSRVALALLGTIPSPSSGGAAGTLWHHAGIDSACCTCHRVPFKHHLDLAHTLCEVQQNLQMFSAREQC